MVRWSFGLSQAAVLPLIVFGWLVGVPQGVAEEIRFQILQMNDVYEISTLAGGTEAGLARVATIRKDLLVENENTLTVMAGDFFSPSALGTAKVGGDRLAGQQMVGVLNAMGLDLATFGNHEFDITEAQFRDRLAESRFQWLSGNVRDVAGERWNNVPDYVIRTIEGETGETIRVGFVGTTIPSNPASYVSYLDPIEKMKADVAAIKDETDVIVALTHLALAEDQYLAENIPEIDIILGGHEHENIQQWRGKDFTPIFKADANARTVYIHRLSYDTDTDELIINSHIKPVTEAIALDPDTAKVVDYWEQRAFEGFRASGFDPGAIIANSTVALDGLESSVRNGQTGLTNLIADAVFSVGENVDLSIFNSGSIRIDDVLPPGIITQYDVIRVLPFGGDIVTVEMSGALLERVLNQGLANRGSGGFLQTAGVSQDPDTQNWLIGDRPLDISQTYRVATVEFLISGKETGLDFLNTDNPELTLVSEQGDIRFALIDQLTKLN
ncbi:bifunctional metallophosphatase/5'-nucleotidase [[Limnothrix rosea] IAM M-220]|uniref:bifunctional metallophosphatase/5'-nucleotidase n=1 Tax=[Limnothrix rosea] IAM M-220 TaxID=454133 RepID=UPI00095BDBAB|nr:bifunctional metallophosphatase/5'-nucleotidase [[Limnothrix rosea] IAM M-220]OKH17791.1 bifunctional metallophosphatase/5'-nucleotidase [[Limnothrix rosea] IAM M-220]